MKSVTVRTGIPRRNDGTYILAGAANRIGGCRRSDPI